MKFEEYIELGNALKQVKKLSCEIGWKKPKKSPVNKCHERASKCLIDLSSDLENLMFSDFPERATTHVFYGQDGITYPIYDGDDPTPEIPFAVTLYPDGRAHCNCKLPHPCRHIAAAKNPNVIKQ